MKAKLSLHEQQLDTLLERIEILDEKSYLLDGEKNIVFQQQPHLKHLTHLSEFGTNTVYNKRQLKNQLIQHLGSSLYTLYCGVPKEEKNFNIPSKKERNEFMDILSQSNYSTINPDRNWKIYSIDANGNAFAEKNGVLRSVTANSYVVNPAQPNLTMHQKIDFLRYCENRVAQPVFYYVYGDTFLAPDSNLIRIYWSIKPEGAALLVEQVTKILNGYKVPFNFKCLNHPNLYTRNDSAVLYFDKSNLSIVKRLLRPIIEVVKPYLTDKHPLFTDVIDTGVSIAEDPGDGQSFGMSRVTIIADALVDSQEKKIKNKKERKNWVIECLKEKGISYPRMSINLHSTAIK